MGKIYIIGLGPGDESSLTLGAINRINSGSKHFLRTEKHPTVKYFKDNNIEYKSYDYIYDTEEDFSNVYKRIVMELKEEAAKEDEINYYVPGNPMVAEKTVELLLKEDLEIEIVSGMSFIEPLIEIVGRDPINGLKIVDGAEFDSLVVDINVDMIITQVYNERILSEVKIILSEIYGDEHKIWLIHSGGVKNEEEVFKIPIFELDRTGKVGALTSIFVPKIEKKDKKIFDFNDIMGIMRLLRSNEGCPWDIEQTHESIRQSLIEEAYEVVDAIDSGDIDNLMEELGDLLLQVVFHSQIAYEEGEFNPIDVTSALGNKLILRHPHVFSQKNVEKSDEVVYNWNKIKYESRELTTLTEKLKDLPKLPALMMSFKVQDKAAEIGFDWDDIQGPIDKVSEEFNEVLDAYKEYGKKHKHVEEELGDLLFAVVNLARFLDVNPEVALNRTVNKFIKRLELMELKAKEKGKDLKNMTLEEMDILWNYAKNLL
jgi:tetrapyrrole methylase family protein/MazG family protein